MTLPPRAAPLGVNHDKPQFLYQTRDEQTRYPYTYISAVYATVLRGACMHSTSLLHKDHGSPGPDAFTLLSAQSPKRRRLIASGGGPRVFTVTVVVGACVRGAAVGAAVVGGAIAAVVTAVDRLNEQPLLRSTAAYSTCRPPGGARAQSRVMKFRTTFQFGIHVRMHSRWNFGSGLTIIVTSVRAQPGSGWLAP